MKQKILIGLLISTLAIVPAFAQTAATAPDLSTDQARVGYTMGFNMGKNLAAQKVSFDQVAFVAGLNAGSTGVAPALTPAQMKDAMDKFRKNIMEKHAALQKAAAEKNEQEGKAAMEKFLAETGVQKIDSHLAYKIITLGAGPIPTINDTVIVTYEGKLVDNTVFDSTKNHDNKPATFPLAHVIPAMQKVLTKLHTGTTVEFVTDAFYAYGANGIGPIPPNATLHFTVTLVSIAPAKAATPAPAAAK